MGDDGEDGVEKIVGDGEPVHLGDVITLSNPNHGGGGYIGADGFNNLELHFMRAAEAEIGSQFMICPKLIYQHQKIFNKALRKIGLTNYDDLTEKYKIANEIPKKDVDALERRAPLVDREIKANITDDLEQRGKLLTYGSVVQLRHVKSGKFITLTKGTARQPGTWEVVLSEMGDEGSWFGIQPGFRLRKEGDPVVVTDQIILKNTKKSTVDRGDVTLHVNTKLLEDPGADSDLPPDATEIHGSFRPEREDMQPTFVDECKFVLKRYSPFDAHSIPSGAYIRLVHKEEGALLCFNEVAPTKAQIEKGGRDSKLGAGQMRKSHKLHLLSTGFDGAMMCSNAVFKLEQTDQTAIQAMNEKIRRNQKGNKPLDQARIEPKEVGGDSQWGKLFRFRHVGTKKYLAASFPPPEAGSAPDERRNVRFYLTDLHAHGDRSKPVPAAQLETLWRINPVNPPKDPSELAKPILMRNVFHLQHAVSQHWVHCAFNKEGQPKYYDSHMGRADGPAQRMVQLVPERPYEDAFGFQDVKDEEQHRLEVRDMNYVIDSVMPALQKYIKLLKESRTVTTRDFESVKQVLAALILDFVTVAPSPCRPEDMDPSRREGTVHCDRNGAKGRRQQLLREQGVLDSLVQMTVLPHTQGGIDYKVLKSDAMYVNIFELSVLANRLVRHVLREKPGNCLYMIPHISRYVPQLGHGLEATDILIALHENKKDVLDNLPKGSLEPYVEMIHRAFEDNAIYESIELAANFMSITCVCRMPDDEIVGIRKNQDEILRAMFLGEVEVRDNCIVKFELSGEVAAGSVRDVRIKIGAKGPWAPIGVVFADVDPKVDPDAFEKKMFTIASVRLYANLCTRNKDAQDCLREWFPIELVTSLIVEDRVGCDDLRAAACELLFRLYVDADGEIARPPIEKTRKFEDIKEDNKEIFLLRDSINAAVQEIKTWICGYLSNEDNYRQTASERWMGRNLFILSVLKLVLRLMDYGVYTQLREVKQLLRPLIRIIDNVSPANVDYPLLNPKEKKSKENPDGIEQDEKDPLHTWRFDDSKQEVTLLMECKLEVCRILNFVAEMRVNLCLTRIMLTYKAHLDACRQKKQVEDYTEAQVEQYIVQGTKLKGCKRTWKDVCKRVPAMSGIFKLVDFNEMVSDRSVQFDTVLMDLTQYKHPLLVSEAFKLLTKQYTQRVDVVRNLVDVQLLCSKEDRDFFDTARSMCHKVDHFIKSDHSAQQARQCTVDLVEATKALGGGRKSDKQQLFKNVGFPSSVKRILEIELSDRDKMSWVGVSCKTEADKNEKRDRTSMVKLFRAAYTFLLNCCQDSNDIKDVLYESFRTYIKHLNVAAIKHPSAASPPDPANLDLNAAPLVKELFKGNRKLCTQITAPEVKSFVSLIVTEGRNPRWLEFLSALVVVNGQPVNRNQQLVIKNLIGNKAKTMDPSLFKNSEQWADCVELMLADTQGEHLKDGPHEAGGLKYHIELVDLLFKCAMGKNKAAEQLCQREIPLSAIRRGLVDPMTVPAVKEKYIDFLWESYIELERPKKNTPFNADIWACWEKLASDMLMAQNTMNSELKAEWWIISEIQYLYRPGLTRITGWFADQYCPEKWDADDVATCERLKKISAELITGVCRLLERPASPNCQITSIDRERGFNCMMIMRRALADLTSIEGDRESEANIKKQEDLRVGALHGPTDRSSKSSRLTPPTNGLDPDIAKHLPEDIKQLCMLFSQKGVALVGKVDPFPPVPPSPKKETLVQVAMTMFAKDMDRAVIPQEETSILVTKLRHFWRLAREEKGDGPWARSCQKLVYAIYEANQELAAHETLYPDRYIRAVVAEVESPYCTLPVRKGLLDILTLTLDSDMVPFVKGKNPRQVRQNTELRASIQAYMCKKKFKNPDGKLVGGIYLSDMLVNIIARYKIEVDDDGQFEQLQGLAIRLLYALVRGNSVVQSSLYNEWTQDVPRTEAFFGEINGRLEKAKLECEGAVMFYEQQKKSAMDNAEGALKFLLEGPGLEQKPNPAKYAIQMAMEPKAEEFTFTVDVTDMLMAVQQLCEENNQKIKDFLHNQQWVMGEDKIKMAVDNNNNIGKTIVQFMEIWVRSMNKQNLLVGTKIFGALTEMIIGPSDINQKMVCEELKFDTINNLLDYSCLSLPDISWDPVELRMVQQGCVRMLQAMLEGQTAGESRMIKQMEKDLKLDELKDKIVDIYDAYLESRSMTARFRVSCGNAVPFDAGLMELAFMYFVLLRQIHDCTDDPKEHVDFLTDMIHGDYFKITSNKKDEQEAQERLKQRAETAFNHFFNMMGRIEINRVNTNSDGQTTTRLERVYFEIPWYCLLLTTETKKRLILDVTRESGEQKLAEFLEKADDFTAEMLLQRSLSQSAVYQFFDKRRDFWTALSFYITQAINAIIIGGVDHEDKYVVDPAADLTGDAGAEYDFVGIVQVPVVGWDTVELFDGKVAYIPRKLNQILTFLGVALIACAVISFVLHVLGFGPLNARMAFKNAHKQKEAEKEKEDPSGYVPTAFDYEALPIVDQEGSCLRLRKFFASFNFAYKYTKSIVLHGGFIYIALYIGFAVLGFKVNIFFYGYHLFDLLKREPELQSALDAVFIPYRVILKVMLLAFIFMYMWTVLGFVFFHDHFNEGDKKEENMCNSIAQCFLFTSYNGLISSEIWAPLGPADLWPSTKYLVSQDEEIRHHIFFTARLVYDVFFFVAIGVVLIGGALFGIILDKFTEIRQEQEDRDTDQTEKCFICLEDQETFERQGRGFETHVNEDHYMWNYIYFIVYLQGLPSTDFNGAEGYVWGKLREAEPDVSWLPQAKESRSGAMVLEEKKRVMAEVDGEATGSEQELQQMSEEIAMDIETISKTSQNMRQMLDDTLLAARGIRIP